MRGFAFLNVLIQHDIRNFDKNATIQTGVFGVIIFFVLSSYLLTYQFYEKFIENKFSFRILLNYFARRFFRIYPCLLLSLIIDKLLLNRENTFYFEILELIRSEDIYWTIYLECRYYVLIPIVAYLLYKAMIIFGNRITFSLMLCFAIFSAYLYFFKEKKVPILLNIRTIANNTLSTNIYFINFLSVFLCGSFLGVILYNFHDNTEINPTTKYTYPKEIISILILTGHFILISLVVYDREKIGWAADHLESFSFIYSLIYCYLIYHLLCENLIVTKVLTSKIFLFLGDISYPGYLIHITFLRVFIFQWFPYYNKNITAICSMIISCIISYIIHITYEELFIKFSKELFLSKPKENKDYTLLKQSI